MPYYDIILGNDLCIYPSYYEPWGYTPLEAVAFGVPCITTDLAGFGLWAEAQAIYKQDVNNILNGCKVVHRTDYNYHEVADEIKNTIVEYARFSIENTTVARQNAHGLSKKALWSQFITFYYKAYDFALKKAEERMNKLDNK